MKKIIILTLFFFLTLADIFGQTKKIAYKKLSDTTFKVGDLILIRGIQFDLGKCEFIKNSKDSANIIADFIKRHQTFKIEIGVHTVIRGKKDINLKLTQCRATKILDYLTKELMLPSDNIEAKGYGDTNPIYSEADIKKLMGQDLEKLNDLHDKNKRIEIKILRTK